MPHVLTMTALLALLHGACLVPGDAGHVNARGEERALR
jgi:hypothetical protein